jgi:hypothetical protein
MDTLTAKDMASAYRKLNEASERQRQEQYDRSLKDHSKLNEFYKRIGDDLGFVQVVQGLANGLVLVLPTVLYKEISTLYLKRCWLTSMKVSLLIPQARQTNQPDAL